MLISNFNEQVKSIQKMKTPIVTKSRDKDIFIGAYDRFNIIRTMPIEGLSPELYSIFQNGGWLNFDLKSENTSGTIPQELISEINGPVMVDSNKNQLYFVDVYRELNNKIDFINGMKQSYNKRYQDMVFNEGEFFDMFSQLKATDGTVFRRLDPHVCFSVYKGLIPYNKNNLVTYDIYCGERDFLVEFTTHRKKDPDITTFIRYLYV